MIIVCRNVEYRSLADLANASDVVLQACRTGSPQSDRIHGHMYTTTAVSDLAAALA